MATTVTVTGLSTTITGLTSGTTYYQITAFNGTAGGTPSAVQSNPIPVNTNLQYVTINGQLLLLNGQIAEY